MENINEGSRAIFQTILVAGTARTVGLYFSTAGLRDISSSLTAAPADLQHCSSLINPPDWMLAKSDTTWAQHTAALFKQTPPFQQVSHLFSPKTANIDDDLL